MAYQAARRVEGQFRRRRRTAGPGVFPAPLAFRQRLAEHEAE